MLARLDGLSSKSSLPHFMLMTTVGRCCHSAFRLQSLIIVILLIGCDSHSARDNNLVPGIRIGARMFIKKTVGRIESIGAITDLTIGHVKDHDSSTLIVSGTSGYNCVDVESGQVGKAIVFENLPLDAPNTRCRAVDLEADGIVEFIRWDPGLRPLSVHGVDGRLIFKYPASAGSTVGAVLVADLDNDSMKEFVVTLPATESIHMVNHLGGLVWSQAAVGSIHGIEALDLDGDGLKEIVYIDDAAIHIARCDGKAVANYSLPTNSEWRLAGHIISPGSRSEEAVAVQITGGAGPSGKNEGPVKLQYFLIDSNGVPGRTVASVQDQARINAIAIKFSQLPSVRDVKWDIKPVSDFLAGTQQTRMQLRVFDSAGTTCYEEMLKSSLGESDVNGGAIYCDSENQRLFAAYGNDVWMYSPQL